MSQNSHIRFQMSLVGSKRVAPVRRASPSQDDVIRGSDNTEQTFQQKLQEIKKMRMSSTKSDESDKVVPKKVQTVNGLKTFLKRHGDWVEVVSKSGKVYYYNKRTLVNQWKKPEDWLREEERLNSLPSYIRHGRANMSPKIISQLKELLTKDLDAALLPMEKLLNNTFDMEQELLSE